MIINTKVIDKLRAEYGEAFYLLDSEQFKINFAELKDTFTNIYPHFNIAYSYKTNYTPKLCKLINEMGGYAEVVSEMELEIALRVGVQPNKIIWNGPIKNPIVLEKFLLSGGTVNIDSIEELVVIQDLKSKHTNSCFNLGIRCNYDVNDGVISRFGFDVNSEDFAKVLSFVNSTPLVHFVNFQCHFAKRQVKYWPARAKGMVDLLRR